MGKPNKRVVQQRDDGDWEVRKPGASRASAVTPTQAAGIGRARTILGNDGAASYRCVPRRGLSVHRTLSPLAAIHGLQRDDCRACPRSPIGDLAPRTAPSPPTGAS